MKFFILTLNVINNLNSNVIITRKILKKINGKLKLGIYLNPHFPKIMFLINRRLERE